MFEFLQSISDFFTTGIYTFFEEAAKYFVTTLLIWWVKSQIWGISFAWEVGQSLLSAFNVSSHISSAFGALSSEVMAGITFFRVPEAVNILLSAGATRFVLNMVPGL